MKSISVLIFIIAVTCACNSEDDANGGGQEPTSEAVDNLTLNIQHIVTPIQGQPESRYMKLNMLGDKIYFQELTGSPWNENARLWEYSVTNNQFSLKNARGTSFSWSGWGIKLFNINGYMVHLDHTSEPDAEYYLGDNADNWAELITDVPAYVISGDAAVSGSTAYFLGGNFSRDFTSYFAADEWYNLASFPINIQSPVLTADANYVYSIGGRDSEQGDAENNYFAKYSIQDNSWETLEKVPNGTYGSNHGNKSLIIDNRFLLVITNGNSNQDILDIYDLQENVWKREAINLNISNAYMYEYNNMIYFITSTYNEQTELMSFKIYKGNLENLPN